ncbi:RNA polymerase sigma factor [Propionibacteriaceae bacterium Y2011]
MTVSGDVWRDHTPAVLAALLRRSGDLGGCEDAVQEALLAAAVQWPRDGVPDNPRGWLVRVASRKLIDAERSDAARARREVDLARHEVVTDSVERDDTVQLLLLCCDPCLTPVSRIALTLRAVAGLSTAQIAAGFWVPEATMAQRISRAKATLRKHGATFGHVPADEVAERLHGVRHVLHLVFNEGYTSSGGETVIDTDLTGEAIRLAEQLHRAVPDDDETTGLLALMLLSDARTPARLTGTGDLVPLAEQDRTRWHRDKIDRGTAMLERVLARGPVGPFQLQAAIAGVHAAATDPTRTDWLEICILYRMLAVVAPSPSVTLNLAIAIGMAHGAAAGLAALAELRHDPAQRHNHRVFAAYGHLLELAGDGPGAAEAFAIAARLTHSLPEQRYLNAKAAALGRP